MERMRCRRATWMRNANGRVRQVVRLTEGKVVTIKPDGRLYQMTAQDIVERAPERARANRGVNTRNEDARRPVIIATHLQTDVMERGSGIIGEVRNPGRRLGS